MSSVVVLGGRNLGGSVLDRFLADGWGAAGIARTRETADLTRRRGALAYTADACDVDQLSKALDQAAHDLGGITVIVNAVSVAPLRRGEPFGGGPISEADPEAASRWSFPVVQSGYSFLVAGSRLFRDAGAGGTLVQITNGTAIHPLLGQGLWSAGHAGLRSLVHAAAQELRAEGIRVCLLVVDAPIDSPKTAERMVVGGVPHTASADQDQVADAVAYLAAQQDRAMSYELMIKSMGQVWTP